MRTTNRNQRCRTHSASHNDRTFDTSKAKHIDDERSSNKLYWKMTQGGAVELTQQANPNFEQTEKELYEHWYGAHVQRCNENYVKRRHPEKQKTVEDYYTAKKTSPMETLIYLGDKDDHADINTFKAVCEEYIKWMQTKYPNCVVMDAAIHTDEQGAPHMHMRQTFRFYDADKGEYVANQTKALAEMGFTLPHPDKAPGKYNNLMMPFTVECTKHLQELAIAHGLDIETTARESTQSGLTLKEHINKQKCKELDAEIEAKQQEKTKAIESRDKAYEELADALSELAKVVKRSFKKDRQRGGWTYNGEYAKNITDISNNVERMLREMSKTDTDVQAEYDRANKRLIEAQAKLKDVEQQEQALEQREMALTARERGIDMEVADGIGKIENSLLQEFMDYAVAYGAESRRMVKDFIEKVHEREEHHEQEYDEELDDESIDR